MAFINIDKVKRIAILRQQFYIDVNLILILYHDCQGYGKNKQTDSKKMVIKLVCSLKLKGAKWN